MNVRRTRLSTVGDRAIPVAAIRVLNELPRHVTSAPSLRVFCSRPYTHQPAHFSTSNSACEVTACVIIGHCLITYFNSLPSFLLFCVSASEMTYMVAQKSNHYQMIKKSY